MIQFANKEGLLRSSRFLSFYQSFFQLKQFLQKVLIEVIGVPHDLKVKCDLLRQKNKRDLLRRQNIFLDSRSHA